MPDIVSAHGAFFKDGDPRTGAVMVFINRGNGRFEPGQTYQTSTPGQRMGSWSVAAGDLDGDGTRDLAAANPGAHSVSVLMNRGDGTFVAAVNYRIRGQPWDVAIRDLNRDHHADIVTATPKTISVLRNRGSGIFAPEREYTSGRGTLALAVADLNGDKTADVATANLRAGTVSLHLNRGDGTFRPRRAYRVGPAPQSVAVGDLNGDGLPDLATVNSSRSPKKESSAWFNGFSVLRNIGGGRFRLALKRDVPGYHGQALWSIAIGDLNMDGRADLVAGNAAGFSPSVSVFVNRGHGRFESRLDFGSDTTASWGPHAVGIADLNRDRKPDIALLLESRILAVLLNRPGLCSVQNVQEKLLSLATRTLARANCGVKVRVGHSRFFSKYYPSQTRVIRQKQRAGAILPAGSKVDLVVNLGRRQ